MLGFAEYARSFRSLCDQLSAIGKSVDDTDKVHWFLCGLGSGFKIFSTPMLSQLPLPSFANLVPKALSHEFFLDHSLVILPISRLWLSSVAIFLDVQNMPLPCQRQVPLLKHAILIHNSQVMFVAHKVLFMALNRPLMHGFNDLVRSCLVLGLLLVVLIPLYLYILLLLLLSICSSMLMIWI